MKKKSANWIYIFIVFGFIITLISSCKKDENTDKVVVSQTYYISSAGNDNSTGTSPEQAWKTLAPVNVIGNFGPGSQILFNGGDTFIGGLNITMTGTSASPCTISSYGSGQATLKDFSPYTSSICLLINSEYVKVKNLNFIGSLGTNYPGLSFIPLNKGVGLQILSTRKSGEKFHSVYVDGCTFKYTFLGAWIGTEENESAVGFDDIKLTNCIIDSVYQYGCYVIGFGILNGGPIDQHLNVYIGNNQFLNINGDPNYPSEAQALSVSNTTGITIENNLFANIAGFGGYYAGSPNGGSTAFGVSNCRNFKIQYNEITGTKCARQWDGSAMDADQDAQNGEICYNLTYNNDGPSIQFGSFKDKITSNIVIHNNISYNDVRGCKSGSVQGAIRMWGNTGSVQIFNNSIYIDKTGSTGTPSCISFEVGNNNYITVLNNIFKTTQGIPIIRPNGTLGGEYNPNHISSSCRFISNCYDASGGSLIISTDDTHGSYTDITALAAWQNFGQDKIGSVLYGIAADAGFSSLGTFNPHFGDYLPSQPVSAVINFDLATGSACRGQAVNPWSYVTLQNPMTVQKIDYHGNSAAVTNIGAVN
jgi:hypothetical protein